MAPNYVGLYNELLIQLGWIIFFSVAFPTASLLLIGTGVGRMFVELQGMSLYKKRNDPVSVVDIGIYMDLLNIVSDIGIVICIYFVIFSSKVFSEDWLSSNSTNKYVLAIGILHILFFIKYTLADVIPDEPSWIT